MNLSEKKLNEWTDTLKELNLMGDDESIIEYTKGDCWSFLSQTRGHIFFTEKSIIFMGGLLGVESQVIPYEKIQEMKKCNVGGLIKLIPTGIKVTYEDEKGKVRKPRLSILKRKNWIDFINTKIA